MAEKVLMKGNEAMAEAAIMAGCHHYFGYPITPQTEVAAYMAKRMPKIDGGVFLQAESEIAAINMVIGVASTGKRVMTSSSSPGISLKSEGLSYLAGCDLPALIINVQRGGPGLGSIQPSQSDYFHATRGAGHGDFHMIVLAPASVQEMVDLTFKGFDLGDKIVNALALEHVALFGGYAHHFRAGSLQRLGHRLADAAARTGHNRGFPAQIICDHKIAFLYLPDRMISNTIPDDNFPYGKVKTGCD